MASKLVSRTIIAQLAVAAAAFAVSMSLYMSIMEYDQCIGRLYTDRIFTIRVQGRSDGMSRRLTVADLMSLEEYLVASWGPGVETSGYSIGYAEARDVLTSLPGYQSGPLGRVAIADVMPQYFDIMGIPLVGGSLVDDLTMDYEMTQCVITESLASAIYGGASPLGRSINILGNPRYIVSAEIHDPVFIPIPTSITEGGVIHEHERFVVFRLISDPYTNESFGYALVRLPEGANPVDAMSDAFRYLLDNRPDIQFDIYSEHYRFREGSLRSRSSLVLVMASSLVGFVVVGLGLYSVLSISVTQGARDIATRMVLGATPRWIQTAVVNTGAWMGFWGGVLGSFAYLVAFLVGVDVPILPREEVVARVIPPLMSMGLSISVGILGAIGPSIRASATEPGRVLDDL